MSAETRTERDSLGELQVPVTALWGAQTQRAINNFPVSGQTMPAGFVRALGLIKAVAAEVNAELGELDSDEAVAISTAAKRVYAGELMAQFPVDVYQTGSGTSSNMNANEVIARLAGDSLGRPVSANDAVNCGQSSNDVVPSCIHISAAMAWKDSLAPALDTLIAALDKRAVEFESLVKTGRTHLMDAMPLTLGQEISGWREQVAGCMRRLVVAAEELGELAIGGTAVGTGVNAHPQFAVGVCRCLSAETGIGFRPAPSHFAAQSAQDVAVAFSGQLRGLAVALSKVANDLRWMNSGPLAGLAEIELEALQPGSSIMPGKVNPVLPEAIIMACTRVMGLDAATAIAGQSGNFQLNTQLPLVALNLLESLTLMASACDLLQRSVTGFKVNHDRLEAALARNPILVTALNAKVGYAKAAEIAKSAYQQGRPVVDVAEEMTEYSRDQLAEWLAPKNLV